MPAEPSHRYRAILWDNDGVLVDTERWYFAACRDTLAEAAIELTEALYLKHWLASSGGIAELAAGQGVTETRIAELQAARNARYEAHLLQQELAIVGVRETLEALRPHFTMGIVTSAHREHFEAIHRRTGFLRYFDFALATGDYARSKPHPDPYLKGIARAGFRPEECLAIEDTPRGLAAARAAGIDCWVIPTALTAAADFSRATRVLGSIAEVVPLLLGEGRARASTPGPK